MRLKLVAVGHRQPAWVNEGFAEYAKRLPRECQLELLEVAPERRGKNAPAEQVKAAEAKRIQDALAGKERLVALDERGQGWSSRELATQLEDWMASGTDVALMIGGADGLDRQLIDRSAQRWSLSRLTLPHGLVRVMVAEQLYRAWSIVRGHPYHRD